MIGLDGVLPAVGFGIVLAVGSTAQAKLPQPKPQLFSSKTVYNQPGGSIPQFNPALGTLRSVKLRFQSNFVVAIGFAGGTGAAVNYMMSAPVTYVTAPALPSPPLKALLSASGKTAAGAGGVKLFGKAVLEETRSDAATLAAFRGTSVLLVIGHWNADHPDTMTLDQGTKLGSYHMDYSADPSYQVTYTYLAKLPGPKLPGN